MMTGSRKGPVILEEHYQEEGDTSTKYAVRTEGGDGG